MNAGEHTAGNGWPHNQHQRRRLRAGGQKVGRRGWLDGTATLFCKLRRHTYFMPCTKRPPHVRARLTRKGEKSSWIVLESLNTLKLWELTRAAVHSLFVRVTPQSMRSCSLEDAMASPGPSQAAITRRDATHCESQGTAHTSQNLELWFCKFELENAY